MQSQTHKLGLLQKSG